MQQESPSLRRFWRAVLFGALLVGLAACAESSSVTFPSPPPEPPVRPPTVPIAARTPFVFVANSDGSGGVQLTAGNWPAWSPDGSRIALHRDGSIIVMNADGSQEQQLRQGGFPAWSPDGKRIAFASEEGLAVMDPDGRGVITLLSHGFRDDVPDELDMGIGKPAWSPDGLRIAFEHFGDGDTQPAQIYVMNADGTGVRRLTSYPSGIRYAESDPSWSPDGTRIVFWTFRAGIVTANANGGPATPLYEDASSISYGAKPSWFTDAIVFNTSVLAPAGPAILILTPSGTARVLIQDGYHAAWTRDRTRIAFVRNK